MERKFHDTAWLAGAKIHAGAKIQARAAVDVAKGELDDVALETRSDIAQTVDHISPSSPSNSRSFAKPRASRAASYPLPGSLRCWLSCEHHREIQTLLHVGYNEPLAEPGAEWNAQRYPSARFVFRSSSSTQARMTAATRAIGIAMLPVFVATRRRVWSIAYRGTKRTARAWPRSAVISST